MSYNGRYWVKNTDITWRRDSTPIIRKMAVASQCGETSLYPGRSVTVAGKVKGNIGGNLLQSTRELSLGVWFPSKTRSPITNPELLEVPQTGNSQSTCKVTSGCEHFCNDGVRASACATMIENHSHGSPTAMGVNLGRGFSPISPHGAQRFACSGALAWEPGRENFFFFY